MLSCPRQHGLQQRADVVQLSRADVVQLAREDFVVEVDQAVPVAGQFCQERALRAVQHSQSGQSRRDLLLFGGALTETLCEHVAAQVQQGLQSAPQVRLRRGRVARIGGIPTSPSESGCSASRPVPATSAAIPLARLPKTHTSST